MHEPSEHIPQSQSGGPDRAFQQHLDGLYRFAQALTLDETRAVMLVEETCRRAALELPSGTAGGQERQRLYQILAGLHRDTIADAAKENPVEELDTPVMETGVEDNIPTYRRRVAEQVLERILPVAVTALPDELRALLVLCDVEGMPCDRAAGVLGIEPEAACRKLDEARQRVREAIYAGAAGQERQLLAASLPPDQVRASLERMFLSEFAPPPPSLRMSVDAAAASTGVPLNDDGRAPERNPGPVQGYTPQRRRSGKARLRGVLVAVLLVLATGLAAYFISRQVIPAGERNLIALAAEAAGDVEIDVETSSPEEAERYVQDTFGLRLTLPEIEQAPLGGVSITEVAPDVRMPVFHYEDEASGESIHLFAYSYALLDRNSDSVTLASDVLRQIEDDEHFDLHDLGTERVLVWRNRDDIFVAVTRGDAETLRERILFPS